VEAAAPPVSGRRRSLGIAVLAAAWIAVAAGQAVVDVAETGLPPGLTAPTSPVYADGAWYDIVAVRWTGDVPSHLEIEMGAIDPAGVGDFGMRQPIVEVYIDEGRGGATDLLPGSGLRMPAGTGWTEALRLTGDGAWWWQVAADGERLAPPRALSVEVEGRVVRVTWPTAVAADARVYAISGVYDPFSADGWRRFTETPSPWAFAAEEPGPPVVDVLPGDAAVWQAMRSSGELPRAAAVMGARGLGGAWVWWALMGLGMGMAILGVVWRTRRPAGLPASVSPASGSWSVAPAAEASEPAATGDAAASDAPQPARAMSTEAVLIGDEEVGADGRSALAPDASAVVAGGATAGEPTAEAAVPAVAGAADQFSGEGAGAAAGSDTVAAAPAVDGAPSDGVPATAPPPGAPTSEPAPDVATSTRETDAPTASSRSAKRS
jgi:hypothetical protein